MFSEVDMSQTKEVLRRSIAVMLLVCVHAGGGDQIWGASDEARQPAREQDGSEAQLPISEEGEPLIPCGPEARTVHDYGKTALPFFDGMLVEAYRKHGKRNAKYDEQAEEFLKQWVRKHVNVPGRMLNVDLLEKAEEVCNLGCEDSLVWGLRIPLMNSVEGMYPDESRVRAVLVDAKERGYPTLTRVLLAYNVGASVRRMKYEKLAGLREQIIIDGVREILPKKPEKQTDCRPILDTLAWAVNSLSETGLKQVDGICAKALEQDEGDAWLVHALRGTTNVKLAWTRRGRGYAPTVTEEGWKGFAEYLAVADEYLRKAHKLCPDRPEPAAMMIAVAAAGHASERESVFYWFHESVKAQMDYDGAYSSLTNFIQPKWGGNHAQMFAFARQCLETKRYDTRVPLHFYSLLRKIGVSDKPWFASWREKNLYPYFKELYLGCEESAQFAPRRDWVLSCHAVVAWQCGRYDESLAALGRMDDVGNLARRDLQRQYITPRALLAEVHARGGPTGSLIDRADRAHDAGDLAGARDVLEEALKKADDDNARLYVKNRLAGLQVEEKLETGDWIELTFDKDLTGWWVERGRFERVDQKTVRGWTGFKNFKLSMLHFARVGHRFQFEADSEIHKKRPRRDATLIFCHANHPVYRFRTFILTPQTGKATLHRDFTIGHEWFPVEANPMKNRLQVTVWDKQVALAVNGEVIHRGTWLRPEEVFGTAERIGVGSGLSFRGAKVTYRNLRVRGLNEKPDVFDD